MRVEPTPHVYRNEDRRRRFGDRRWAGAERRAKPRQGGERAQHKARPWFTAEFAAHLLGQLVKGHAVSVEEARRAYEQPESKTPLRPRRETEA